MKHWTPDEIREKLISLRVQFRTNSDLAKHLKLKSNHVSDTLRGDRCISRELARKLGYKRVTAYVRIP